jgi:2-hydroxy-3-oxopropionate reductase
MVGGERADFEAALALFQAVGKTIELVGPVGSGQATKAANQLLVGGIIELVSEAMVLLNASGVDMTAALRVLAGGLAGNRILDRKAESMLKHSFDPGFRVDLHHKDYGLVLAAARDAGVALPVSGLVSQLMAACRAQGNGGSDHSSLLTVIESLNATKVGGL